LSKISKSGQGQHSVYSVILTAVLLTAHPVFFHTPRPLGPRRSPGYSSAAVHSRGKTMAFPRLRQFLVLQLFCQMNFSKEMKFLLTQFKKKKKNLWMLLCFLCPWPRPWTPRLAAHDARADHRAQAQWSRWPPPTLVVQLPPSGSRSQTRWYLHHHSRSCQ
jgi:hypothetical protein